MATARTFPGVFIEEIPSGVRTIVGVPTSIAAFIGRTRTGPTDTPVIINSFGDFARSFGGLDADSSVSYAVRDFFQNENSTAFENSFHGDLINLTDSTQGLLNVDLAQNKAQQQTLSDSIANFQDQLTAQQKEAVLSVYKTFSTTAADPDDA